MLVFANGAVKRRSTWLFHIVWELTGFAPPPDRTNRNREEGNRK
jgi:hypothetical protein